MDIARIGVVGTGLMGKGIVQVFASYGYKVDMFGRRDDIGDEFTSMLDGFVKNGKLTDEKRNEILENIEFLNISTFNDTIESDLIIETVSENLDIKKDILKTIGRLAKNSSIIASNTSSFLISELSEFVPNPENFVGMHFFSPVPLMKLVELVKGKKTSDDVIDSLKKVCEGIEKISVRVNDSSGFALNRCLFVMINEAVKVLQEGRVESAEELDKIFMYGMNMKVGPLRLADLVGIDVTHEILDNMKNKLDLDESKRLFYSPSKILGDMLKEGKLGKKSRKGFYDY